MQKGGIAMKNQNVSKCCEIIIKEEDNMCKCCGGTGLVPELEMECTDKTVCPECNGTGFTLKEEE